MKKTIAKIMAAAMVLSAVPAVALPTLTAKADGATTVTLSSTFKEDGTTALSSTGSTGITVNKTATVSPDGKTVTDGEMTITAAAASSASTATDFFKAVTLAVNSSGEVVVKVDTTTAANVKALIAAVKAGTNGVTVEIASTNEKVAVNQPIAAAKGRYLVETATVKTTNSAKTTVYPGGEYDTEKKVFTKGIIAEEGDLIEGNVYADFNGNSALELQILKGDPNVALDDNDDLRGETLDLTTVKIGSVTFDVVKIGAQALKKAHMKKFVADNNKRLGKGALRSCKQLTRVHMEDGQKVRKINSKAFYGDKNLKNIVIDGRKLSTVGKNAFSGVKKNCTVKIRAKKSKFNSDVKMIKKNGGNKNLKFVRK